MSKPRMQTFGNYVMQCKLGKGSYGEVFRVTEKREHSTKEVRNFRSNEIYTSIFLSYDEWSCFKFDSWYQNILQCNSLTLEGEGGGVDLYFKVLRSTSVDS